MFPGQGGWPGRNWDFHRAQMAGSDRSEPLAGKIGNLSVLPSAQQGPNFI